MKRLTPAQKRMLEQAMQPDGYALYGYREAKTAMILKDRGLIVAPSGLNEWNICKIYATVRRA